MMTEEYGRNSEFGGDRGDRGDRGGFRRSFRPRGCEFCKRKNGRVIDYKDVDTLKRYITERGAMEPRRKLGVCSRCQGPLTLAIKRARHLALLPFTSEHIRVAGVDLGRSRSYN